MPHALGRANRVARGVVAQDVHGHVDQARVVVDRDLATRSERDGHEVGPGPTRRQVERRRGGQGLAGGIDPQVGRPFGAIPVTFRTTANTSAAGRRPFPDGQVELVGHSGANGAVVPSVGRPRVEEPGAGQRVEVPVASSAAVAETAVGSAAAASAPRTAGTHEREEARRPSANRCGVMLPGSDCGGWWPDPVVAMPLGLKQGNPAGTRSPRIAADVPQTVAGRCGLGRAAGLTGAGRSAGGIRVPVVRNALSGWSDWQIACDSDDSCRRGRCLHLDAELASPQAAPRLVGRCGHPGCARSRCRLPLLDRRPPRAARVRVRLVTGHHLGSRHRQPGDLRPDRTLRSSADGTVRAAPCRHPRALPRGDGQRADHRDDRAVAALAAVGGLRRGRRRSDGSRPRRRGRQPVVRGVQARSGHGVLGRGRGRPARLPAGDRRAGGGPRAGGMPRSSSPARPCSLVPLVLFVVRDRPADLGLRPLGAHPGDVLDEPATRHTDTGGAGDEAVRTLRESARSRTFWILFGTFCDLRLVDQRPDRHPLHPFRPRPRHADDPPPVCSP